MTARSGRDGWSRRHLSSPLDALPAARCPVRWHVRPRDRHGREAARSADLSCQSAIALLGSRGRRRSFTASPRPQTRENVNLSSAKSVSRSENSSTDPLFNWKWQEERWRPYTLEATMVPNTGSDFADEPCRCVLGPRHGRTFPGAGNDVNTVSTSGRRTPQPNGSIPARIRLVCG